MDLTSALDVCIIQSLQQTTAAKRKSPEAKRDLQSSTKQCIIQSLQQTKEHEMMKPIKTISAISRSLIGEHVIYKITFGDMSYSWAFAHDMMSVLDMNGVVVLDMAWPTNITLEEIQEFTA